jgi:hypothetical protein
LNYIHPEQEGVMQILTVFGVFARYLNSGSYKYCRILGFYFFFNDGLGFKRTVLDNLGSGAGIADQLTTSPQAICF